jgi:P-type Ca2+ transporter type 2C
LSKHRPLNLHHNPDSKSNSLNLPEQPWALSVEEILKDLRVEANQGLNKQEVQTRLRYYGPNRLRKTKAKSAWKILINQFASIIVVLLGMAAVVAFIFGKWIEGIAIGIALIINTVIGFLTELKAIRSMEALHKLESNKARIRRQGKTSMVPVERIVPGDVVLMRAGDMVPADLRVVEANNLQVDESALTGESVPVAKKVESIDAEASLAERSCMLFKGTAVTTGSAVGVTVSTGMRTVLGGIATMAEEAGEEFTPLERRLERLGRRLIWGVMGIAVLLTAAGLIGGKDWLLVLETGIAMAVAAVPEGLPIVATIALARGMWRMAQRNALINRLSAVETLGATTVIFTDKTGTLTENRMKVARLELSSESLEWDRKYVDIEKKRLPMRTLEIGVLCNNASLDKKKGGGIGDPLEIALLEAATDLKINRNELLKSRPEVREEAFSTETRMMATFHQTGEAYLVAVKGAPEAVLKASTSVASEQGEEGLTQEKRIDWHTRNEELAKDGLRVLALACKRVDKEEAEPYRDLTLLGLVGLWDPPREDVSKAIEQCQAAGIRVIMVTGDHPATALSIAEKVGLAEKGDEVKQGKDLKANHRQEDNQELLGASIFARVSPEQKLDIIALHQKAGAIVAMTGDGVNDAPALQKADIGVAMGKRGTQVAREAADMVLQDDQFSTIVTAVYHGRVIFGNIRKFIFFLLSGNISQIIIITIAALVNAPLPLLPLQILYLNLVGDVFPALALGVGEGDSSVMKRPPRNSSEPILPRAYWLAIVSYAIVIATAVLGGFAIALLYFEMERNQAVTISFLSLSLARLSHVFNMRDQNSGTLLNEITRNPFIWVALAVCLALLAIALYLSGLRQILGLVYPTSIGWTIIIAAGILPLLVGQAAKIFQHARNGTVSTN